MKKLTGTDILNMFFPYIFDASLTSDIPSTTESINSDEIQKIKYICFRRIFDEDVAKILASFGFLPGKTDSLTELKQLRLSPSHDSINKLQANLITAYIESELQEPAKTELLKIIPKEYKQFKGDITAGKFLVEAVLTFDAAFNVLQRNTLDFLSPAILNVFCLTFKEAKAPYLQLSRFYYSQLSKQGQNKGSKTKKTNLHKKTDIIREIFKDNSELDRSHEGLQLLRKLYEEKTGNSLTITDKEVLRHLAYIPRPRKKRTKNMYFR